MSKESGQNNGNHPEFQRDTPPRYLSQEELVSTAKRDFGVKFDEDNLKEYVGKRITGVEVNGVNVLFIDIDHKPEDLDPLTLDYINSPNTKIIGPEYAHWEIEENAGLFATLLHKMENNPKSPYYQRLQFARQVEEVCKDSGKPIVMLDIADKPSYMVARAGSYFLPFVAGETIYHATKKKSMLPLAIGQAAELGLLYYQLYTTTRRKGIKNPDEIPPLDRLIPDLEQARRLNLADKIVQLTAGYNHSGAPGDEKPQFVFLEPRAHGMRVADIIVNPHRLDRAQSLAYRTLTPWLDHGKIRTYTPNGSQMQKKTTRVR